MSSRVAYLQRAERGIVTLRVRLVGQRADEVFDLPATGSDQLEMSAAALWLSEHLPKDSPRDRALDLLCLDADGLTCAWVNTPSADPSVVRAMALAGAAVEGNEGGAGVLGIYASNPMESALQPLGADTPGGNRAAAKGQGPSSIRRRMGVLAGSDIAGRLLVDALDARGLGVGAACSLWHAMARAWDPASGTTPSESSATITTGVVIIEPGTSPRLHWVWSRHGELLAGGTARVAVGSSGAPKLHEGDSSRLAADWLAWAAQLGLSPSRLIVVIPEPDPEGDASSAFGAAIGRAWPGARAIEPADTQNATRPLHFAQGPQNSSNEFRHSRPPREECNLHSAWRESPCKLRSRPFQRGGLPGWAGWSGRVGGASGETGPPAPVAPERPVPLSGSAAGIESPLDRPRPP